jgi:lysophospholipase L1-like esterase
MIPSVKEVSEPVVHGASANTGARWGFLVTDSSRLMHLMAGAGRRIAEGCLSPCKRRITAVSRALFLVSGALLVAPAGIASATTSADHWVGSWTASPTDAVTPFDAAGLPVPEVLADQTLRMIVTPHLGGTEMRLHLSNRFGYATARFADVTVGIAGTSSVSDITPVTFGSRREVSVTQGHDVVSDPVAFKFAAFTPLAVSIFIPGIQSYPTKHWNANAMSYYSPPETGDLTTVASNFLFSLPTEAWLYVDGIDVEAPVATGAIVAFGDSITDGFVSSTPLSLPVSLAVANKNGRYPDDLQRRIDAAGLPISVLNAGIGSNRLVTDGEPLLLGLSGVQRFQADALDVPGVKGVIVQEGINDLGIPPAVTTPSELITGYKTIIAMAHAEGVKIWLGTLLPASNAIIDGTATAPMSEIYREQVNAWIRSQHLADGVIDFDAAMRDPHDPSILNPLYASTDHLHPNLLGYEVMANTVSLAMLQTALTR